MTHIIGRFGGKGWNGDRTQTEAEILFTIGWWFETMGRRENWEGHGNNLHISGELLDERKTNFFCMIPEN